MNVFPISMVRYHSLSIRIDALAAACKRATCHIRSSSIQRLLTLLLVLGFGLAAQAVPVLNLPGNIAVGAADANGSVVTFNVTATDTEDPAPIVISVPASGSVFPIGVTTVRVTATNSSGASKTGSFTVTVRDTVPPELVLTDPKEGKTFKGRHVLFSGRATDDRAVARIEVVLNKSAPEIVKPDGISTNFKWSIEVVPETGFNTAVVTAYDRFNNPSTPIIRTLTFINQRPEFTGSYNGLLSATVSSLRPIDNEGLINVNVLTTGVFTGKVILSGTNFPIKGVFTKDGSALFTIINEETQETSTSKTLPLVKTALSGDVTLGLLALKLDITAGAERITGALTQGTVTVATIAHADHALYTSAKNPRAPFKNVPVTLADPSVDKGQYTAIFAAGDSPNNGIINFPDGDGWARIKLSSNGTARILGKLADGSPVSYSNTLSKDNDLPIFVLLYLKKGLLTGTLHFDPAQVTTDARSIGLKWYKRANAANKLYPAGWPEGISLDLIASKFVKPSAGSGLNVLGIAGVAAPAVNAVINFTDGLLPATTSNDIAVASNSTSTIVKATSGFPGAEGLKLSIARSTGRVSGSFIYPGGKGKAVPFSGIVYQKTHSAAGFFLYYPAAVPSQPLPDGVSGGMQILAVP